MVRPATPEQIADCVLALKDSIDRLEAENRRLRGACESAIRCLDDLNSQYLIYGRDTNSADGVVMRIRDALKGPTDD